MLGVVLLLLVTLLPAAHADPGTRYTFDEVLDVPVTYDQQGLAHADGVFYVAFDRGSGNGQVIAYDTTGAVRVDTGLLPLGHAAELSFRRADGNFYVASGGRANATYVRVLDVRRRPPAVLRTYDFTALGNNGMVAIDNTRDRMLVFSGPDAQGRWVFTWSDFGGRTTPAFTLAAAGLPQGIEMVRDQILLLTSARDKQSNTLRVLSLSGQLEYTVPIPVALESEGLATALESNRLHLGYRVVNRVDRMSPVLTAPIDIDLMANRGAESGAGGTTPAWSEPIPSWRASGMTVLRYGSGGFPSASSPGPPNRGALFFSGGTTASGRLQQEVALSGLPTATIDASQVRYAFSAWLGGYRAQEDRAKAVLTFRDAAGASLGTIQVGPVTATDRGGVTGLLHRSRGGTLPRRTRSMSVTVEATRSNGTNLDAFVDEVSLVLSRR